MTQASSNIPPAEDRPHRPADDTEEIYFEGSPLLRAHLGSILGWSVVSIILIAGIVAYRYFQGSMPIWWVTLIVALLAIGLLFLPWLLTKTLRYRITNYRIDYGQGLLSRNIDTLELWHVEDIHLHQSMFDRMLGVGTIVIFSHDDTNPKLALRGLPHPEQIFNTLKQRVIAVKRQRGVIKMDPGQ